MLKAIFISLFFCINTSYAVDLLQSEKAILCNSFDATQMSISRLNTVMLVNNKKYSMTDFLDTAIVAKSSSDYSFFQATQNNEGFLITGKLYNLVEGAHCKITGFSKTCSTKKFNELVWSSTDINFTEKELPLNMEVMRYGIYPVNGTYFIARNGAHGAALIDFGAKIKLIVGDFKKVQCSYHKE